MFILQAELDDDAFDFLCFTETWLTSDTSDANLLGPAGSSFIAHRADRATGQQGGGVCALIRSSIPHRVLPLPESPVPLELLPILFSPDCFPHIIITWYRSPSGPRAVQRDYLYHSLKAIRSLVRPGVPLSILCDSNFPSVDFQRLQSSDSLAKVFLSFVNELGLEELVRSPTRGDAQLDLVLTTCPDVWSDIRTAENRYLSDHREVTATLSLPTKADHSPRSRPPPRPNFKQANWEAFAEFLSGIDWRFIDSISADSTEFCGHLMQILGEGISRFVPICSAKRKPLALPTRLKRMRQLRVEAFRSRHLSPALQTRFTALDRKYRAALKRYFTSREAGLLSSARAGLYRHYKSQSSLPASYSQPPLLRDGRPCSDDKSKADLLAETFASVYSWDKGHSPTLCHPPASCSLSHIDFSRPRIEKVLSRLSPKLSAGFDGIPPLLLKRLAEQLSTPLSLLFSRSFCCADVPDQFRTLRCTAIPKPGKDNRHPANWRPISLSSSICKVGELTLNAQLCSYLEANNLLHPTQFGYRQGRSTQGQLASFVQSVSDCRNSVRSVHVLWADCSRAFDTPPHRLIAEKLQHAAGLRDPILSWLKAFISGRSAAVTVGSAVSESYELTSGFAQGSPLSATLWTIFINDLLVGLSRFVSVGCYADDIRCHSESPLALQQATDFLQTWCRDWQISLAPAKCVYSIFGPDAPEPPSLAGIPIPTLSAPAHRDLGILVDPSLSFAPQVQSMVTKAKGVCARIMRSFHSSNPHVLFAAFTVYARPHLEYASVAWNSISKSLSDKIEGVQKSFTWKCYRRAGMTRVPYAERLVFFGAESLAVRRRATDASFCHAVLKGKHECPIILPEVRASERPTRFAPRAKDTPSARKAPRRRIARLYNSLPSEARSLALSGFKPYARDFLARV